jgi:hypothetical protein
LIALHTKTLEEKRVMDKIHYILYQGVDKAGFEEIARATTVKET